MSITLSTPQYGLVAGSQQIKHKTKEQLNSWTQTDHVASLKKMKQLAQESSYMLISKPNSGRFNWEYVPYAPCSTPVGRIIQQLQVVWRLAFGGVATHTCALPAPAKPAPAHAPNDAFCTKSTIEKQWVITGKKVNVLFNYAPIGLGGKEKLHFLIVPKAHRARFTDVTQAEYSESMQLATKLVAHITKTRSCSHAYLFHKTGQDAGQSVPHWHMHLIFAQTPMQDFFGKLQVVKNILLSGSSPMKSEQLAQRVAELRRELEFIR